MGADMTLGGTKEIRAPKNIPGEGEDVLEVSTTAFLLQRRLSQVERTNVDVSYVRGLNSSHHGYDHHQNHSNAERTRNHGEGGQQRHSHLPRVVETILAAGNSVDVQQHPKTVPGTKTEKKKGQKNNFTHSSGPAHEFCAIMYVASKQADTKRND